MSKKSTKNSDKNLIIKITLTVTITMILLISLLFFISFQIFKPIIRPSSGLTEEDYEKVYETLNKDLTKNIKNHDYLLVANNYLIFTNKNLTNPKKIPIKHFRFANFIKDKNNEFLINYKGGQRGLSLYGNTDIQFFNPYRTGFSVSSFKKLNGARGFCQDANSFYYLDDTSRDYTIVKLDKNHNRKYEKTINFTKKGISGFNNMICLKNKIYINFNNQLYSIDKNTSELKKEPIPNNLNIYKLETNNKNIFFIGQNKTNENNPINILGKYNPTTKNITIKINNFNSHNIVYNNYDKYLYQIHHENDFNSSLIKINTTTLNQEIIQIPIKFVSNDNFQINKDLFLISNIIYNITSNQAIKNDELYYDSSWINFINLDYLK